MQYKEFRKIPYYPSYGVSKDGIIVSYPNGGIVKQYHLNGYLIVDAFYDSLTETLPVHRAVALAWVHNPDPENNIVVNHLDGDRLNNWWENLEWTTYSGNNYHAVNTGLRSDNLLCRIRDFETGEVSSFSSVSQASNFMGFPRHAPMDVLLRKQFGALVKGRYEFRFGSDPTPWFYESRPEKITPARYMVEVRDLDDNLIQEVFSNRNMLKEYQLYDSPYGKSIPGLVKYANEKFPDKIFIVRDSYAEDRVRVVSPIQRNPPLRIRASKDAQIIEFSSLRHIARHFNVDRKSITHRLNGTNDLDGWIFTKLAS